MDKKRASYCSGAKSFQPSQALGDKSRHASVIRALNSDNDLEVAVKTWFSIDDPDKYIYHANTSVQLSQVQQILNRRGPNGLHNWYWREMKGGPQPLPPPPTTDIDAYISIFLPTTATAAALKSFASNAKRSSVRSAVAKNLLSRRFVLPSHPLYTQLSCIPKTKAAVPCNPYLDFWAWSCHALEWCGPVPIPERSSSTSSIPSSPTTAQATTSPTTTITATTSTVQPSPSNSIPLPPVPQTNPQPPPPSASTTTQTTKTTTIIMPPLKTHPLLAIYMHHFGCAIPTHESLTILQLVAGGRPIADVGSGSGYWTAMLRAYCGPAAVIIPVDSAQSEWRVNWLDHDPDGGRLATIRADGAEWLSSRQGEEEETAMGRGARGKSSSSSQPRKGGRDMVLLVVYPIVGPDGTGTFMRSLMAAYAGDTVAVVGTQNRNGYTGFRDMTVDEYMEQRVSEGWRKVVQLALPSFAGKDEALFVFQRGDRLGSADVP